MRTWIAESDASPEAAWELLSRPSAWPAWAPHVRGAVGLGAGEVVEGARGFVRLLGVIPVPAHITEKVPGRSWSWRVAPGLVMHHRVVPRETGCAVAVDLEGPLTPLLAPTYGPVIQHMLNRLARAAD
jgi:hypothetical protein